MILTCLFWKLRSKTTLFCKSAGSLFASLLAACCDPTVHSSMSNRFPAGTCSSTVGVTFVSLDVVSVAVADGFLGFSMLLVLGSVGLLGCLAACLLEVAAGVLEAKAALIGQGDIRRGLLRSRKAI